MSRCRSVFTAAGLGILLALLLYPAAPATAQQTGEECVLHCGNYGWCDDDMEHFASWSDNPNAMYSAGSHDECLFGTCEDKHPACGGPEFIGEEMASVTPLLDELERAIDAEDGPSIGRALALLGGRAVLNEERSAVQLRSCDGGVAGHFDLPEAFLTEVQNATAHHGPWFRATLVEDAAPSL